MTFEIYILAFTTLHIIVLLEKHHKQERLESAALRQGESGGSIPESEI